jgi:Fic family protein
VAIVKRKAIIHGFLPVYSITPGIVQDLLRIERLKTELSSLEITPALLENLRRSARLDSTHYSTAIEGNLLSQAQVEQVVERNQTIRGRERDVREVKGYYAALEEVQRLAQSRAALTEKDIQTIHALVMGSGRMRKPTPYRDGQNVIRDSRTNEIVYLPPEASAVRGLMAEYVLWLNAKNDLPVPLRAAIGHYQFATIHPYYDGNGRTARLLTTLILHHGGYGMNGIYSLEEYYANGLSAYYGAISVGPSHNYHLGRAEADITGWIAYFVAGMADAFEKVHAHTKKSASFEKSQKSPAGRLDVKKRTVLARFADAEFTSREVAEMLLLNRRYASQLCEKWVDEDFLAVVNPSKKARCYRIADKYARQ